jgi:hypothetical protein
MNAMHKEIRFLLLILLITILTSCNYKNKEKVDNIDAKTNIKLKEENTKKDSIKNRNIGDWILKSDNEILKFQYVHKYNRVITPETKIFSKPLSYYLNDVAFDEVEIENDEADRYSAYNILDYYPTIENDTVVMRVFDYKIKNHRITIKTLNNFFAGHYNTFATYHYIDNKQITHYDYYHSDNCAIHYEDCFLSLGISPEFYYSKDNKFLVIKQQMWKYCILLKIIDLRDNSMAMFCRCEYPEKN